MPSFEQIIWSLNAVLVSWTLRQYFIIRREINLINLSLVKNYATNEALEKLIQNQNKMLDTLQNMQVSQATMYERIERYHETDKKK